MSAKVDKPPTHDKKEVIVAGYLAATVIRPLPGKKEEDVAVLIASATAVPRVFYRNFMIYLAVNGVPSISFDWSGTHQTLALAKQKYSTASNCLSDWAEKDLPTMIDFLESEFPGKTLVQIGHSVGGHVLPISANGDKITRAVTVGTQNAFVPLTPYRHRYNCFWEVLAPATVDMFKFYQGSRMTIIGDVPSTAMREWRSWARHPLYNFGSSKFRPKMESYDRPILAISIEDDEYATEKGVILFHMQLASKVTFWHVDPADYNFPIGHIGLFMRPKLWGPVLKYIQTGSTTLPEKAPLSPLARLASL